MKSIRTDPSNHAAEGDERIRTAVPAPSTDAAYELLREALDKLERTEQFLDGRHFRPYPVRKRKEALRDLHRAAARSTDLAYERLATCFTCGGPFDPWAYGYPRQHCRACELVGAVVVSGEPQ